MKGMTKLGANHYLTSDTHALWNAHFSADFLVYLAESAYHNSFSANMFFSDTEDASETDLAKHDDDDYVEIKEQ